MSCANNKWDFSCCISFSLSHLSTPPPPRQIAAGERPGKLFDACVKFDFEILDLYICLPGRPPGEKKKTISHRSPPFAPLPSTNPILQTSLKISSGRPFSSLPKFKLKPLPSSISSNPLFLLWTYPPHPGKKEDGSHLPSFHPLRPHNPSTFFFAFFPAKNIGPGGGCKFFGKGKIN